MFHAAARSATRDATLTAAEKAVIKRIVRCQRSARSRRIVRFHWRRYRAVHRRRFYWQIQYGRLSLADQGWLGRIASCESGHRADAHDPGGTHHGMYQYLLSTARAAGFKTDPHLASVYEQSVRTIWWRNRAGASQWQCKG
jgi:hypothetical protein